MIQDIIYYDTEAQRKLMNGIEKIAKAVACTMGPSGRSAILGGPDGLPVVTKDGVSVANYFTPIDPIENMGAELIKQAAANTVEDAGDGTTTSTVLAYELIKEFLRYECSNNFKDGVREAANVVLKSLKEDYTVECDNLEDLTSIAMTSTKGDHELSKLVAEAVYKAGKDGSVETNMVKGKKISYVNYKGYKMNSGWLTSNIINNQPKLSVELGESYMLLLEGKLENFDDVIMLLKYAKGEGRALIIVAEDFSDEVKMKAVRNIQGSHKIILLKSENFGEYKRFSLEDLAHFVGSKVYPVSTLRVKEGLPKVTLGDVKKIDVYQHHSIVVQGDEVGDISERLNLVKTLLENVENDHDKDKLQTRVAQLSGGYSSISIGGHTEGERKERFDRAEDAVGAVTAALMDGILPGGGNPLYKIGKNLVDSHTLDNEESVNGWHCVMQAIEAPLRQIIKNTGNDITKTIEKMNMESPLRGIDASTCKDVDLIDKGIIDPFKVTTCAFENAISIALLIASVGVTIQNKYQYE